MTDLPVSLDNLREMTGGDPGLEKELFGVFITSAEDCLKGLKANAGAGQEDAWRSHAHAWKGMSLNLGAEKLGKLCADAQFGFQEPPEKKAEWLKEIEAEFDRVKVYLSSL